MYYYFDKDECVLASEELVEYNADMYESNINLSPSMVTLVDGVVQEKIVSVDLLKKHKLEELMQIARFKYTQGFKSDAHQGVEMYYDSDTDKQREISQAAGITEGLFNMFFPEGFPIRSRLEQNADKQIFHLTLDEMHKLCADMLAWCQTVKFYVWSYQDKINECKTKEELDSIVLEFPNEVVSEVTTTCDTGDTK